MLSEEMQNVEATVTAGHIAVCLQVIARAAAQGAIRDNELSTVGGVRDSLVKAMQEATGINFDQARAAQARAAQQAQQRAVEEARRAQAEAQAQAESAEAPADAPAEEAPAEVVMAEEAPAEAPAEEAKAE